MKPGSYFKNGIVVGVLLMSACRGLHEDVLGQARYAILVRETWLPWYWTVPIELFTVLLAAAIVFHTANAAAKEAGKP